VVSAFDLVLRSDRWAAAHRPEVVVRLGAPPASKVLAAWLAGSGAYEIIADPFGAWLDPERHAAQLVPLGPGAFCRGVVGLGEPPSPARPAWMHAWAAAEAAAQAAVQHVVAGHEEPTEPGVARAVTGALGPDATLMVASSMPVRDVEWFGDPGCRARVVANRGANGIDGVVSTALGVAAGSPGPTVALLGDLAFLHDSGGLLWAGRRGIDLTMVVVDNDGGGIFSFLPQAEALPAARFDQLFGTPHGIDLAALAQVHGLTVAELGSADEVGPAVVGSMAAGGVGVVLVRTDRAVNVAVHDELNAAVAAALA
jgi:2-succinyl-5-enolpyruvyl-6-hydroxy-3-cyclohexene-1-carboxylate synthase